MSSDNIISSPFWKNVMIIATIIGGVLYIEKSVKETIKESMLNTEYRVAVIERTLEAHIKILSGLSVNVACNNFKIQAQQDFLKGSYIKQKSPKIEGE